MFQVNVEQEVETAISLLSKSDRESLLRKFVTAEAHKKVREINKNYKDPASVAPESFATRLVERLTKKISESTEEQVAVAAKSTRKSTKTVKVSKAKASK